MLNSPRHFAADLAAENHAGIEFDPEFLERFRVAPMHLAQRLAHAPGGLEHIGTGLQVEGRPGGAVLGSRSSVTTAWVMARFPATCNTMTRSPGRWKTEVFRKLLI